MSRDRAVSDTLGYAILFGVVLLSITLTATFGVGGLTDARDGTITTNAQQSMRTLSGAADDLRASNTTSRQVLFRTSDGTLGSGQETTVTIRVDGTREVQRTFRPIVYRYDGTTIAYEAGAVIESSDGSGTAAMVEDPPFVLDSDTVILPVVTTHPVSERELSGGIVATQLRRNASQLNYTGSGSQSIEFEIETTPERATAWRQQFEADLDSVSGASCTQTSGTVTCTWSQNARVIIREFRVDYQYAT